MLASSLPSWYPAPESKPAPMPLLLVQGFVNTLDLDGQSDLLVASDSARAWFVGAGLLRRRLAVTAEDLVLAKDLRAGIRSLLDRGAANSRGANLQAFRDLAEAHQVRFAVRSGGILELQAGSRADLSDGLFELLLIIHAAQHDGSWARLKLCANPDCRWAFYDRSRNQLGSWCDMAVCGNRLKNRRLYARRR